MSKSGAMKHLIVWGTGAHAGNVLATLERLAKPEFASVALISDLKVPPVALPWSAPLLGDRRLLQRLDPQKYAVFPAVGLPQYRKLMMEFLFALGFEIPTLVDRSAILEPGVRMGPGCLIRAQSFVGYQAHLAAGVLLNTGAQISHEAQIGDYASLFSGARVLGRVKLETGVLVGANAAIAPGTQLGAWSRIAMASAVYQDIPAYATVQGNPAIVIKQFTGPPPAVLLPVE